MVTAQELVCMTSVSYNVHVHVLTVMIAIIMDLINKGFRLAKGSCHTWAMRALVL